MEQLVQGTYSLKREQFSSEDLGRASGPRPRPRAAVLAGRPGRRRTCPGAAGRGAPRCALAVGTPDSATPGSEAARPTGYCEEKFYRGGHSLDSIGVTLGSTQHLPKLLWA